MRISDWSSDVCSSDLSSGWLGLVARRESGSPQTLSAVLQSDAPGRTGGDGGRHARLLYADGIRDGRALRHAFLPQRRAQPGAGERDDRDCVRSCRPARDANDRGSDEGRSEEQTSELQSLMRISYGVFCLKKKIK